MDIVVAMKQIPDLQQIRIRNGKPVMDNVPLLFGNIDKNALEAAVQVKEVEQGKVTVVCVGSQELPETVKEALAAGADEASLVIHEGELDSRVSAQLLAEAIKRLEHADLILFGEGSGDNYSSQVGSRVARRLGLPQVGFANKIDIQGDKAIVTRSLEDREEILEVCLPAVVTMIADLNKPRIPSVTQILKAGRKPQKIANAEELGIELLPKSVDTISNTAPEIHRKQVVLSTANDLMELLKKEGFVGGGK